MFMPRRRPLLRGAMIGGAGYMAGKNSANKRAHEASQEQRIAELEAQQAPAPAAAAMAPPAAPAPAAPAAGGVDVVAELTKLKGLLDAGVLTQDEFEVAKAKVLAA
jgi:3-oxoacyl-ACP reductase-like protein